MFGMNDLNASQRDTITANKVLSELCEKLMETVAMPDCLEIPLVILAAQYAEFSNAMIPQDIPELYESLDDAITRVQHNIRVEMLRLRQLRNLGQYGPNGAIGGL